MRNWTREKGDISRRREKKKGDERSEMRNWTREKGDSSRRRGEGEG